MRVDSAWEWLRCDPAQVRGLRDTIGRLVRRMENDEPPAEDPTPRSRGNKPKTVSLGWARRGRRFRSAKGSAAQAALLGGLIHEYEYAA